VNFLDKKFLFKIFETALLLFREKREKDEDFDPYDCVKASFDVYFRGMLT